MKPSGSTGYATRQSIWGSDSSFVALCFCCSAKIGGEVGNNARSRRVGSLLVAARFRSLKRKVELARSGYQIESHGVFTPLRLALTEVRFKANRPASDGEYKIELQDDALLMVLGERRRLAHYTNYKHRQLGPCSQTTFHAATIGHPQDRVPRRLSAVLPARSRFPQPQRHVEGFRPIGVQKRDDWRRGVFMLASGTPPCLSRQAAIAGGVIPHIICPGSSAC